MKSISVSALAAEGLGTALLAIFGVGTAVIAGDTVGTPGIALAFGLTLLALVYAIGPISGCHINPAVTIGALIARAITPIKAAFYIAAQAVGAVIGAPGRTVRRIRPSRIRHVVGRSGHQRIRQLLARSVCWRRSRCSRPSRPACSSSSYSPPRHPPFTPSWRPASRSAWP